MRYGDIKYHDGSVRTLRPRRIHTCIYVHIYIYTRILYMFIHDAFCSFHSSVGHCFLTLGVWSEEGSFYTKGDPYTLWCNRMVHTQLAEPISKSNIGFIYCILYLISLYAIGTGSIYICQLYLSYLSLSFFFTLHREKKKTLSILCYNNTEDKLKIFLLNH